MAYKIGIMGPVNTGKSFSRRFIEKGENVFVLQPSMKASHLLRSAKEGQERLPIGPFNIKTDKFKSLRDAKTTLGTQTDTQLIDLWNRKLEPGKLKPENILGNVQLVKDLNHLAIWLKFIDIHMPWVDTVVLADFTHYISEVISDKAFIDRKHGGEAFQRFWELAGTALTSFITGIDNYRNDLVVVTEFHADYDERVNSFQLYTPAGKMLTEKFKPESYYDVLLCTKAVVTEAADGIGDPKREYFFVTERTTDYPLARAMNIFDTTLIPNNLQFVLNKVRKNMGIPDVVYP